LGLGDAATRDQEHHAMTDPETADTAIDEMSVYDYARRLFDAHGANAIAEAAQKASQLEQQGNRAEAETWRHIEAALKMMRGPAVS
jgi:tryptophan 2,3-dioxygenase